MSALPPANRIAPSATRLLIASLFALSFCAASAFAAQNYAHPTKPADTSTKDTQTSVDATGARTTENHIKSGNRSVDSFTVEKPDANGGYQPSSETETETIKVDVNTTRTVERTYQWDLNGQKYLMEITEEEARSSPGGETHLVSTTSDSDGAGHLHVSHREVADTKTKSAGDKETTSTFYNLDVNGNLAPTMKTQEVQQRLNDRTVQVKKTILGQDSTDHWSVDEVDESTITKDGKVSTTDQRISRADSEGHLSQGSRTVTTQTETASGAKNDTVETYSTDSPGLTPDGALHLVRKVTTVQNGDSAAKTTEQQVQQPVPGDPNSGLQVTTRTQYTVQYGGNTTQQQNATETRDVNGSFEVTAFQNSKSTQTPPTQPPAAQTQQAPSQSH